MGAAAIPIGDAGARSEGPVQEMELGGVSAGALRVVLAVRYLYFRTAGSAGPGVGASGVQGSRPVPGGGDVGALRGGIRARVEGGAGVGAQPRASGGAHGGGRILCSQWPAHSGWCHV